MGLLNKIFGGSWSPNRDKGGTVDHRVTKRGDDEYDKKEPAQKQPAAKEAARPPVDKSETAEKLEQEQAPQAQAAHKQAPQEARQGNDKLTEINKREAEKAQQRKTVNDAADASKPEDDKTSPASAAGKPSEPGKG